MFERYSYRARCLIVMALLSAKRRRGSYVEPEDLLDAIIREDRRGAAAVMMEVFFGTTTPNEDSTETHRPFLSKSVATHLLRELHEDPDTPNAETPSEEREPLPSGDLPVSQSLKQVLALVAKTHKDDAAIEPLDLLAGLVEDRDSRLTQLLRDHGITRQKVAQALDSGPSTARM
jgi:ATP-dependent Clp protease ATP-binding subunit ClpA